MKLYLGTVYILASEETEKVYIGSTTQLLTTRFSNHKSDYRCGKGGSYRELLKYPDVHCHELDRLYVTQSRADPELLKLEGKYQLINKDICVNKLTSRGLNRKDHDRRCKHLTSYKEKQKIYRKTTINKQSEHFRNSSFFGQLCKLYKIYN